MRHVVRGEIAFSCDGCPETLETGTLQARDAQRIRERSGWSAVMVRGEWQHLCEECGRET